MVASSSAAESKDSAPAGDAAAGSATDATRWNHLAERGSLWGMRFTAWCYRTFGRRAAEVLIHGIVTYFFATDRKGRAASLAYQRRINRHSRNRAGLTEPGLWECFLHYREFALSIGDRLAIWFGDAADFEFEMEGEEHFDRVKAEGGGAILIGAHVGSFDALRWLAVRKSMPVNVLMFTLHATRINQLFREISPESETRVIAVDPHSVDTVFEIRECLRRGELVAILGDRMEPGDRDRSTRVSMFGDSVDLPQGPYLLASLLGSPVFTILAMRESAGRYSVFAEKLSDGIRLPRSERDKAVHEFATAYAGMLERYTARYPYQWFNFFDYWGDAAR
jgi:predicted LPLAT superfamily acyltransferase